MYPEPEEGFGAQCPRCGIDLFFVKDGKSCTCTRCGEEGSFLNTNLPKCGQCGERISVHEKFCSRCGSNRALALTPAPYFLTLWKRINRFFP